MPSKERPYKLERNAQTGKMERKPISNTTVKETIMQAFGITNDKDYRRFFDTQKNKIYTYNTFNEKNKISSVQTFLYAQAKSRLKYGDEYKESKQVELVNKMPAYSKTKGKDVHDKLHSQANKNVQSQFAASIARNMQGFINAHTGTKENPSVLDKIREKYKDDPAKLLGAMTAYAETLKDYKKDAQGNFVKGGGGFALGSTAGSVSATKFKYGEDEFSI